LSIKQDTAKHTTSRSYFPLRVCIENGVLVSIRLIYFIRLLVIGAESEYN